MPFWTSTSLTLILRQAAAVARQIPRTTGAVAISGRRARQAFQRLSRETFPSLSTPGHLLGRQPALAYAVQPIRIGSPRFQRPLSTHARLLNSSKTFRSGSSFALPRGPRVSTNLGLGSARTFASGPSASGVQNVPVVLRAFASLLSDEEVDKSLPRATRFKPYNPRRDALRRHRRRVDRCPSVSSIDSRIAELSHFFPYTRPSPASVVIPPTAESLVTLGTTTVLSLPLSPSLSALLTGTSQVPYLAAEVGVAILSSLTLGVLSLQEAFSIHYWHRIGPLLARLDSLGLLDSGPGSEGTGLRHEVVLDHMGRPDILRLTFMDRSEDDVRVLLDGCLEEEGGRVWWGLKEVREGQEEVSMELSKKERREMMEVWDETDRRPELSQAAQAEQVQVIFEAPESEFETDISLVLPVLDTASSSYSPSSVTLAGLESWHESGTIDIDTPTSVYTPISELDLDLSSTSSNLSSPLSSSSVSLTESLLSHLSSLDSSSDSARWAVSPSENDSDVESAIEDMLDGSGSEVWGEEWRGLEVNMASSEDFGGWIGAGQGFGLAQPW